MLEHIRQVPGEVLDRPTYHAHMAGETANVTGIIWKLERQQSFTEAADDPAWHGLSQNYLVHFATLAQAKARFPSYHLHQPC